MLKKLYSSYVKWRDDHFCDFFQCSIGDIVLQRDTPSNNQLLLTSRLMDVESYMNSGNSTFPNQNRISYKAYGNAHMEERGNKHFLDLIKSYQRNGYRDDSYITCDNSLSLMDGNHRMGIHLFYEIDIVKVKMVHRKVIFEYGADWYYKVGLESVFMEHMYQKYADVQKWLVETGNTFCAIIRKNNTNDVLSTMSPISDLKRLTTPLRVVSIDDDDIIILQFSLLNPQYKFKNGRLVSLRAQEVLNIMKKRYGEQSDIEIGLSCYEGKKLWDVYIPRKKNSKKNDTV